MQRVVDDRASGEPQSLQRGARHGRTIHTIRTSRSLPSSASPTHPFTCTPTLDFTLRLSGIPFLVGHLERCTETRQRGKEGRWDSRGGSFWGAVFLHRWRKCSALSEHFSGAVDANEKLMDSDRTQCFWKRDLPLKL